MAEKMMRKAPMRCRLYVESFGVSPSAKYAWCNIGCRLKSDKCHRCPEGYLNLDDIAEIQRNLEGDDNMDYDECCGNCKYHRLNYSTGAWECTCE